MRLPYCFFLVANLRQNSETNKFWRKKLESKAKYEEKSHLFALTERKIIIFAENLY